MKYTKEMLAELHEGSVTPHGYINEYRNRNSDKKRKVTKCVIMTSTETQSLSKKLM